MEEVVERHPIKKHHQHHAKGETDTPVVGVVDPESSVLDEGNQLLGNQGRERLTGETKQQPHAQHGVLPFERQEHRPDHRPRRPLKVQQVWVFLQVVLFLFLQQLIELVLEFLVHFLHRHFPREKPQVQRH